MVLNNAYLVVSCISLDSNVLNSAYLMQVF